MNPPKLTILTADTDAACDPETGTSFAFLTNGYPLAGYDHSLQGRNRQILISNLGNDLVKQTSTHR